jgi:hypothetical protein
VSSEFVEWEQDAVSADIAVARQSLEGSSMFEQVPFRQTFLGPLDDCSMES